MENAIFCLLTRGNGKLPRRVSIVNDVLYELRDAPDGAQECHILSKICELVREARGEKMYTRDLGGLLAYCLQTNDEKAWETICDDAVCGLFSKECALTHFEERPNDAACFVWHFQSATQMMHSAYLVKILSLCIQCFSPEALAVFSESLRYGQGNELISAYAHHCKSLPSKTRVLALQAFGSVLCIDTVFDTIAREVLEHMDTNPLAEDLLAILMASPCASRLASLCDATDRKEIVTRFHMLALKMPLPRRQPYFLALSHIAREEDKELRGLIIQTLKGRGNIDPIIVGVCKLIRAIEAPGELSCLLSMRVEEKMCG